jgi:hypothetical protein
MAKATPAKRQYKTDLQNLSEKDIDILSKETKEVMKKYKMEKQGVYDRRFALNKKIKQAGLTVDEVINKEVKTASTPPKKIKTKKAANAGYEAHFEVNKASTGEIVVSKQIPVIMKPIEINFDNFSIKLNGVPKNISVNPDTHAIEIEL